MDNLTKEQRRKNMQAIQSKDTSIEIILRKSLWQQGIRYRKNYSKLPGKPDIAITKYKIAVFCDNEFWHGMDWEINKYKIKSNQDYWFPKIERNMQRDKEVNKRLRELGWTVLRFWGKDIQKNMPGCIKKIIETVEAHKTKS